MPKNSAEHRELPTVMVVEDDEDIRSLLSIVLETSGIHVNSQSNGERALSALHTKGDKPDVILLDLVMPVMDGWHFRESQLKDSDIAEIPVVILSGGAASSEDLRTLRPDAVLEKPLDIANLVQTVQRFSHR
jgi:CheY-like chemotaxis protein